MGYLLYNGIAVTGGTISEGIIRIEGDRIKDIILTENSGNIAARILADNPGLEGIDLGKRHVFAGGIDAHVHFREPGMTHKADMASESAAAVLGGVTSFIDMPNTNPPTVTVERLLEKLETAKGRTYANYGFHLGATNGNAEEIASAIKKCPERFGGIKVFLGSSTGNMLVNDKNAIEHLFRIKEKEILVHCEDESIIRQGLEDAKEKYGEDIPFRAHSEIRSREACLDSSMRAVDLAMKYGTRLHMLHISTSTELLMLYHTKQRYPAVTVETSANYLWFTDKDYDRLGSRIKCNPSIKTEADRMILRDAFLEGTIDTIGTDHAPHTEMEKEGKYTEVPSGMPSIQHSLQMQAAARFAVQRKCTSCGNKAQPQLRNQHVLNPVRAIRVQTQKHMIAIGANLFFQFHQDRGRQMVTIPQFIDSGTKGRKRFCTPAASRRGQPAQEPQLLASRFFFSLSPLPYPNVFQPAAPT